MKKAVTKILIVEDEAHLAAGLKLNLELEGYVADVAMTAREAGEKLLAAETYSAMILDVMLPDIDGFELCQRLRDAGNFVPVMMLTARSASDDRVRGLEAGADDYMVKPFNLAELLARVRSMLRRQGWTTSSSSSSSVAPVLEFGNIQINFDTHEVFVGEKLVKLTQLELDLVRYFSEHPGRVITRDTLLENVWKLRNYHHTRTVDNFISRLRRRFEENPTDPVHFVSVRGAGYKFVL